LNHFSGAILDIKPLPNIGLLRLLQAEVFDQPNGYTWVPYMIIVGVAVVMIWLSLTRIQRPSLHKES
jgi:hypothetical protein